MGTYRSRTLALADDTAPRLRGSSERDPWGGGRARGARRPGHLIPGRASGHLHPWKRPDSPHTSLGPGRRTGQLGRMRRSVDGFRAHGSLRTGSSARSGPQGPSQRLPRAHVSCIWPVLLRPCAPGIGQTCTGRLLGRTEARIGAWNRSVRIRAPAALSTDRAIDRPTNAAEVGLTVPGCKSGRTQRFDGPPGGARRRRTRSRAPWPCAFAVGLVAFASGLRGSRLPGVAFAVAASGRGLRGRLRGRGAFAVVPSGAFAAVALRRPSPGRLRSWPPSRSWSAFAVVAVAASRPSRSSVAFEAVFSVAAFSVAASAAPEPDPRPRAPARRSAPWPPSVVSPARPPPAPTRPRSGRAGRPPRTAGSTRRRTRSATRSRHASGSARAGRVRRRTAGPRPWPSLPTTRASGPRRSACRAVSGASASAPTIRSPSIWRSASAPARSSTGARSRCSTAPAEALTAAGLSGAWCLVGKRTPCTPAASALRSRVPTFWGSSSESSTSTNGGSPRSRARARISSGVA